MLKISVVLLGVLIGQMGWATSQEEGINQEDIACEKSPTPDVSFETVVSVASAGMTACDLPLVLWRSACDAGYDELAARITEGLKAKTAAADSPDLLSRLPLDLIPLIAAQVPGARLACSLSLQRPQFFLRLVPVLKERHWQHELNLLKGAVVPLEGRWYQTSLDEGYYKLHEAVEKDQMMHASEYKVLKDPKHQAQYYKQFPSIKKTMRFGCELIEAFKAPKPVELLPSIEDTQINEERSQPQRGWKWYQEGCALRLDHRTLLPELSTETVAKIVQLEVDGAALLCLSPLLIACKDLALSHLYLSKSENKFAQIPLVLGDLTSLKFLALINIPEAPARLENLINLQHVLLSGEAHETHLTQLSQNPSLTKLTLRNVRAAPAAMDFKQLQSLSVSRSGMKDLPIGLYCLPCLKHLEVKETLLETLPPAIAQLTTLTKLDLPDNKLKTLPPEVFQIAPLKEVNVSRNAELTSLPVSEIKACQKSRRAKGQEPLHLTYDETPSLSKVDRLRLFAGL